MQSLSRSRHAGDDDLKRRRNGPGGVNVDNAGEWIKAGCVAVGAGGALTGGGKTAAEITETAKKFIAAVKAVRA
ncbi:MAG: hypothetical protein E7F13_03360 [Megasphaera sp.]|nr:hypothetical protein [Megasphaera sp.]